MFVAACAQVILPAADGGSGLLPGDGHHSEEHPP